MNSLSSPVGLIRRSFQIFFEKKNLLYLVIVMLPALTLKFLGDLLVRSNSVDGRILLPVGSLAERNFYILFILLAVAASIIQVLPFEAIFRVVGGLNLSLKDTFLAALKKLWKFFLLSLLVGLIVTGGLILLIVPGIIFGVWFGFSTWILVSKGYGVKQSLKESKSLVKGRFWKVLGRVLVFIVFTGILQSGFSLIPVVGTLITTVFGALFLLPYYLLYKELEV